MAATCSLCPAASRPLGPTLGPPGSPASLPTCRLASPRPASRTAPCSSSSLPQQAAQRMRACWSSRRQRALSRCHSRCARMLPLMHRLLAGLACWEWCSAWLAGRQSAEGCAAQGSRVSTCHPGSPYVCSASAVGMIARASWLPFPSRRSSAACGARMQRRRTAPGGSRSRTAASQRVRAGSVSMGAGQDAALLISGRRRQHGDRAGHGVCLSAAGLQHAGRGCGRRQRPLSPRPASACTCRRAGCVPATLGAFPAVGWGRHQAGA